MGDLEAAEAEVRDLAKWLAAVGERLEYLKRTRAENARDEAPELNVFETLGVQSTETRHSAFLAWLLDPDGSHAQGDVFLRSFLRLRRVGIEGTIESFGRWSVTTEESTHAHGRLDIVLRCRSSGVLLVIENKIYAQEGEGQLSRYLQWMSTQAASKKRLVYLTLDGQEPRSMEGRKDEFATLSYKDDILDWLGVLSSDSRAVRAAPVRSLLSQYCATLRSLTGEGNAMSTDPEVTDLLCQPDSLGTALDVAAAVPEVKRRVEARFWLELEGALRAGLEHAGDWRISAAQGGIFDRRDGGYLSAYPKSLGDDEPPLYFAVQCFPSGEMWYGVSWRTPQASEPVPGSAVARLKLEAGSRLEYTHQWWLAYRESRAFDRSRAFLLELARGEKPTAIEEITRELVPVMRDTRELLIAACEETGQA
ncbi:MAG: PD-(D/E)XK nuclease family protein [Myxococcota bacterium]